MGYGIKIKKANGDEIISENKRPLVIIAVIDATHSMNDEPTILANSFLIDGLSLSVTPVTIVTNYSEFILSGDIFLDKNLTFTILTPDANGDFGSLGKYLEFKIHNNEMNITIPGSVRAGPTQLFKGLIYVGLLNE